MRKQILFLLASVVIFTLTYLKFRNVTSAYTKVDKISIALFDQNEYSFDYKNVVRENIEVYWLSESHKKPVLINGSILTRKRIQNSYGKNFFDIYYKQKLILSFPYYKVNKWYIYKYFFKIELVNGKIGVTVIAKGLTDTINLSQQKQLPLAVMFP